MRNVNANLQEIIAARIASVRFRMQAAAHRSDRDPTGIKLIAVSKNFDTAMVRAAYDCGLRDFGENRVQEAEDKYGKMGDLRETITLHMIGHLQTNKARLALKIFDMIHSIDSTKLAEEINRMSIGKVPVFIEVNVAGEESKFGFMVGQIKEAIKSVDTLTNIEIKGLMTVAPNVKDPEEVRHIFAQLKKINDSFGFKELSMGMTDDFEVAIEEGATMIRVGRAIFGERRYIR